MVYHHQHIPASSAGISPSTEVFRRMDGGGVMKWDGYTFSPSLAKVGLMPTKDRVVFLVHICMCVANVSNASA